MAVNSENVPEGETRDLASCFPVILDRRLLCAPRAVIDLCDSRQEIQLRMHTSDIRRDARLRDKNRFRAFSRLYSGLSEAAREKYEMQRMIGAHDLKMKYIYSTFQELACSDEDIRYLSPHELKTTTYRLDNLHSLLISLSEQDLIVLKEYQEELQTLLKEVVKFTTRVSDRTRELEAIAEDIRDQWFRYQCITDYNEGEGFHKLFVRSLPETPQSKSPRKAAQ